MLTTASVESKRTGRTMGAKPRVVTAVVGGVAAALLGGCAVPVYQTRTGYDTPAVVQTMPVYDRVGTIERIEAIDTRYGSSGGGAVLGAVIGGVLGSRFGGGFGRSAATAAGVAGGAIVGDQSERARAAAASRRSYRIFVQYDDGGQQRFIVPHIDGLRTGERVRYENGALAPA